MSDPRQIPAGTDPSQILAAEANRLRGDLDDLRSTALARISGGMSTNLFLGAPQLAATDGTPTLDGLIAAVYWPVWLLDAASQEAVAGSVLLPTAWASIDLDLWWTNAGAGVGNVVFDARANNFGDTETISAPGAGVSTVAAPAQNVIKKSAVRSGVSVTAGEILAVIVFRDGANGADTLANDIGIIGINVRRAS
jgi:hypothetical protein